MTHFDPSSATLDRWQTAVKKRAELQDLLHGVDSLVQDGSIKQVDRLQPLVRR